MKKETTIKETKIKSIPLTDFSEKRFIDFFKVIKDFTRIKYNGVTIFIDPVSEPQHIEIWKDNIGLILYSEDRMKCDPNFCMDYLNGRILGNRRFFYIGEISVRLLPGDSSDINTLFTKKKIYEIFDEYLRILKEYKKTINGPIVRNTSVELKADIKEDTKKKPRKRNYKKKKVTTDSKNNSKSDNFKSNLKTSNSKNNTKNQPS